MCLFRGFAGFCPTTHSTWDMRRKSKAQSTKLGDLWHPPLPAVVDPVQNPKKALREAKTAAMEKDPHHHGGKDSSYFGAVPQPLRSGLIYNHFVYNGKIPHKYGPANANSGGLPVPFYIPYGTRDEYQKQDYARHEEICTGVNPINEDREVIDLSDILPNNDPRVQFAGDSDSDEDEGEGAQ